LQEAHPQAPCSNENGFFDNLTTTFCSIKLKEEILLNIISKSRVEKLNQLQNPKSIETSGTKKRFGD
jgi:hypothetical protein